MPTKGAKGAAGKSVDVESIDFNKKILHGYYPSPCSFGPLLTSLSRCSVMASSRKHSEFFYFTILRVPRLIADPDRYRRNEQPLPLLANDVAIRRTAVDASFLPPAPSSPSSLVCYRRRRRTWIALILYYCAARRYLLLTFFCFSLENLVSNMKSSLLHIFSPLARGAGEL